MPTWFTTIPSTIPQQTQLRARNGFRYPLFCDNTQTIGVNTKRFTYFSTGSATRRRRRGTKTHAAEEPQDNSAETSARAVDQLSRDEFQTAAETLLDRIESSVAKLKDYNDGLEIERHPPLVVATSLADDAEDDDGHRDNSHGGQLLIHVSAAGDMYWGGGTYELTIHSDSIDGVDNVFREDGTRKRFNGYVSMQSPLSGTFTYVYNIRSGEWEGTEDGHALLGMFTRDFIRQCQGVPDF